MNAPFGSWGLFPADIWRSILQRGSSVLDLPRLACLNRGFSRLVKEVYSHLRKRRTDLPSIVAPHAEIRIVDVIPQSLCVLADGRVAAYGRKHEKVTRVDLTCSPAVADDSPAPRWVLLIMNRTGSHAVREMERYSDEKGEIQPFATRVDAMCAIPGTTTPQIALVDNNSIVILRLDSLYNPAILPQQILRVERRTEGDIPIARRKIPFCSVSVGIAVDPQGRLWVPEISSATVCAFSVLSGEMLMRIGSRGRGAGQFIMPVAVAVDESSGAIVVSDVAAHTVQVFDQWGRFVRRLCWKSSSFFHPHGLDIDGNGNILIADTNHYRIQIYDTNGRYLSSIFTGKYTEPNRPWLVKMLDNGEIVVLESTGYLQMLKAAPWKLLVF